MRHSFLALLLLTLCAIAARGQSGGSGQIPAHPIDPATCDSTKGLLYYNTTMDIVKYCSGVNKWTVPGAPGIVWFDGVRYPYTAAGLQQAILDCAPRGGLGCVVMIGSTVNAPTSTQQIELGITTITIPSFVYLVGAGRSATGIDYFGGNCAFDFPAGTHDAGIKDLSFELDYLSYGAGICLEGSPNAVTHDNYFENMGCGAGVISAGSKCFLLTSSGGAAGITRNHFSNIWIYDISEPIVSNGDQQNTFLGVHVTNFSNNDVALNGGFNDDVIIADVTSPGSTGAKALWLSGKGNSVVLNCAIGTDTSNLCINEPGSANEGFVTTNGTNFAANWSDYSNWRVSRSDGTLLSYTPSFLMAEDDTHVPPIVVGQDSCYASAASHALKCSYNGGSFMNMPQIIASGAAVLGSSPISAASCAGTVSDTAPGILATDTIEWSFSGEPGAGFNSGLTILPFASGTQVNFQVCNPTSNTVAPGVAILNWKVIR